MGNTPTARAWTALFELRDTKHFSITTLMKTAKVNRGNMRFILPVFLDEHWLTKDEKVKGFKSYQVNIEHPIVIAVFDMIGLYELTRGRNETKKQRSRKMWFVWKRNA